MAHETVFLVQAFKQGKGTRLIAETPVKCRSLEVAQRKAETMLASKAGVVAFSTWGDAEAGEYDEEPTIIFKAGLLPAAFEEV